MLLLISKYETKINVVNESHVLLLLPPFNSSHFHSFKYLAAMWELGNTLAGFLVCDSASLLYPKVITEEQPIQLTTEWMEHNNLLNYQKSIHKTWHDLVLCCNCSKLLQVNRTQDTCPVFLWPILFLIWIYPFSALKPKDDHKFCQEY